jgi:hypothetical protein
MSDVSSRLPPDAQRVFERLESLSAEIQSLIDLIADRPRLPNDDAVIARAQLQAIKEG